MVQNPMPLTARRRHPAGRCLRRLGSSCFFFLLQGGVVQGCKTHYRAIVVNAECLAKVPPSVPRSVTVSRIWFCADSRAGLASATKKVITVVHVNILDFMLHLVESWKPRGRFSRTTAKEQR